MPRRAPSSRPPHTARVAGTEGTPNRVDAQAISPARVVQKDPAKNLSTALAILDELRVALAGHVSTELHLQRASVLRELNELRAFLQPVLGDVVGPIALRDCWVCEGGNWMDVAECPACRGAGKVPSWYDENAGGREKKNEAWREPFLHTGDAP